MKKSALTQHALRTAERDYVGLLVAVQGWSKEDGRNGIGSIDPSKEAAFKSAEDRASLFQNQARRETWEDGAGKKRFFKPAPLPEMTMH